MFLPVRLLALSAAVVELHAAATFLERFAVGGHIALRVGTSVGKERKSLSRFMIQVATDQDISQDLETGCSKVAILEFLGVQFLRETTI